MAFLLLILILGLVGFYFLLRSSLHWAIKVGVLVLAVGGGTAALGLMVPGVFVASAGVLLAITGVVLQEIRR